MVILNGMENKKDTGGGSDTFAGEAGKSIDRIQITIKYFWNEHLVIERNILLLA